MKLSPCRFSWLLLGVQISVLFGAVSWRADAAISDVMVAENSFNPTAGKLSTLSFTLSKSEPVTVEVFDSDGGLVRTLVNNQERAAGMQKETWDGRDLDGKPVPNAPYSFTIITQSGAVFDPWTFSGGFVDDVREGKFLEDGLVDYRLPKPARVLIRLGIKGGPMLKTLVDWAPRTAGSVTEYWDWKDEDRVMNLRGNKAFTALITYVDLPDATVITYGNDKETYRQYKLGRGKNRPLKPDRGEPENPQRRLRAKNLVPPLWKNSPKMFLEFPKATKGQDEVIEIAHPALVHVDVAKEDKEFLLADQFEIIFYVDNVFFAEAERGHVPFNWKWELNQIPEGEHVLTVNISSFRGQVGVASKKVRVVKREKK